MLTYLCICILLKTIQTKCKCKCKPLHETTTTTVLPPLVSITFFNILFCYSLNTSLEKDGNPVNVIKFGIRICFSFRRTV